MGNSGFIAVIGLVLLTLGGCHWYLARRLNRWVRFFAPKFPGWISYAALFGLMLTLILGFVRSMLAISPGFKQILKIISAYWMGIFIYLLLFFVVTDLIVLAVKLFMVSPMGLVRFIAGTAAIGLTATVSIYGFLHAARPQIIRYEVPMPGQEMNIVLISDIHLGAVGSEERLAGMVEKINALEPDIICIAGDIFDSDFAAIQNPDETAQTLRKLRATYGVYGCLGNHDAGSTYFQMRDYVNQCGIRLLNDEYVVIDERLLLVGRLDGTPIGGYDGSARKPISQVLEGADRQLPVVVMDHNPANAEEYTHEADLILCGHTHKGQIFPGSLITGMLYTVDHGHYQKDADSPHIIVTSGVGTWGMPMRVGTDSEIVQIRLG